MNAIVETTAPIVPSIVDAPVPDAAPAAAAPALVEDERGALTFVEWLILFAVVVVIIALAANVFAKKVEAKYEDTGNTIEGLDVTVPYAK